MAMVKNVKIMRFFPLSNFTIPTLVSLIGVTDTPMCRQKVNTFKGKEDYVETLESKKKKDLSKSFN